MPCFDALTSSPTGLAASQAKVGKREFFPLEQHKPDDPRHQAVSRRHLHLPAQRCDQQPAVQSQQSLTAPCRWWASFQFVDGV